jgi:four helix bundle protein
LEYDIHTYFKGVIIALYNFLPIYKTSYDLLLELFKFTKDFNKEYKYTIGESIKKEIMDMIILIYKANSKKEKLVYIQSARENIETVRVFLRLLKDLKQVNTKKFVRLNDLCENVSKQLVAWEKYNNK